VPSGTAAWLPPGAGYCLQADGPEALRLDSVSLPAGAGSDQAGSAAPAPEVRLSRLRDCAEQVTGNRRFRVLFGPDNGCDAATQFVGEIPPGRAPDHSHPYDEVVLVLDGSGVLHAGPADHPLAPGSCVHLPPGQVHCLENTGATTLWVLGVFHPGGSPAAKQERSQSGAKLAHVQAAWVHHRSLRSRRRSSWTATCVFPGVDVHDDATLPGMR
jgi:quercetin dioxygenase-like cupin family protein